MKDNRILRTISSEKGNRAVLTNRVFSDSASNFIFRKTERLVHAIHLVTEHLTYSEPIRSDLRNKSIVFLDEISKCLYKGNFRSETSFSTAVRHLLSAATLLETLVVVGLISETNYIIINREIEYLLEIINKRFSSEGPLDLPKSGLFNVEQASLPKIKDIKDKADIFIKDIDNSNALSLRDKTLKGQSYDGKSKVINENDLKNPKKRDFDISDRKRVILESFKNKDKLTVKDISVLLPQYSEKTIQRELVLLVAEGTLSKEGKKRWTFYFLAKKQQ